MRRGFTLLELIIVIIILGILATIGFTQYARLVEKGRISEAKTVLGQIRTAEEAYYLEHNTYVAYDAANLDLAIEAPTVCTTTHYFSYDVVPVAGPPAGFDAHATRCAAGGKMPDIPAANVYVVTLDETGAWTGDTAGYY